MENSEILYNIVVLLSTAIFVVYIFKRLNLSPVLGYFAAGAIIGDNGAKFVMYENVEVIAEYGVVFLLYVIGLELSMERLKAMRKYVFGLGTLQVFITSIIFAYLVIFFGGSPASSVIIGGGLALSSTAVVLQVVQESGQQYSQLGRISLAILLLQDFIVVPLLVIVPLLASDNLSSLPIALAKSFGKASITLLIIFTVGRLLLRPLLRAIASDNESTSNEIFIATTLLIALASAFGTEYMGLSLALGAFVAGILVAETEYQHKAEESVKPFKGLLLGLFFMSVGMKIDIWEIYQNINKIILVSFLLISIKASIIYLLCILFGFKRGVSFHSGLLLSQGGEFAFILFKLAINRDVIEKSHGDILLPVVTLSMALTPLLSIIGKKIGNILDKESEKDPTIVIEKNAHDLKNHVIIGGFGRIGKTVARILQVQSINYIALDVDENKVKEENENGFPVYKGNISQINNMIAAGVERAVAVILCADNEVTVKKSIKIISEKFPEVQIIVKSQDLSNSTELYKLGASTIIPADYETGLQLGSEALKLLGVGEYEIARIKSQFRAGNYIIAKKEDDLADEFE